MFSIQRKTKENQKFIEVSNDNLKLNALINLTEGSRLQEFQFKGVPVIKELDEFPYEKSYASSFLFPFVSRTENGEFEFEGQKYVLDKNEPAGKNALHGLIYNKEFTFLHSEENNGILKLMTSYVEKKKPKGFPFDYEVVITYHLGPDGFQISMKASNKGKNAFPFTIGWHPYFYMPNRTKSAIEFDSNKIVEFDENLITKEVVEKEVPKRIELKNASFDNCFILNDTKAKFETDAYTLHISSDAKENYLQLYTPPNQPLIAIEPMIGLSNSLNNKIGLQHLEPYKSFEVNWQLKIDTHTNE